MNDRWFKNERRVSNLLNDLNDSDTVFRIFPKQRFIDVIKNKELTLVNPKMWDDPFENFLLSSKVTSQDGTELSLKDLASSYFGQCWTIKEESDAMWRIYSDGDAKNGIKVKTTVKKLFDAFFAYGEHPEIRCYFGKVKYMSEDQIIDLLSDPKWAYESIFDSTGIKSAQSLLFKRNEFEHEAEARLIYACHSDDKKPEIYQFPIEPNEIFDEIIVDPRLSPTDFNTLKSEIMASGCTIPVSQSKLYKIPNLSFTLPINI